MHFSGDINLGNLLTILSILAIGGKGLHAAGKFFVKALRQVDDVVTSIREHAERLTKQESLMGDVVHKMQKLITQIEFIQDRVDINHRMDHLRKADEA